MPNYILKIEDRYLEYSTIPDAPVSEPMTLADFEAYYRSLYGEQGMRGLPARMARVETKGTSSMEDDSWQDSIVCNRFGPDETELTPEQFAEWVRSRSDLPNRNDTETEET